MFPGTRRQVDFVSETSPQVETSCFLSDKKLAIVSTTLSGIKSKFLSLSIIKLRGTLSNA